ncbi:MAG: DUF192 domain-containing protein [Eggerthellaceae bacterium]|nr:DUF192 domain-containing protein [Eggerthellaceae bacterium]
MPRLLMAVRSIQRLQGLLLREERDALLLLAPCRSIHTYGMRYAIDIAFANSQGRIVEAYRDVLPKRHYRCRRACAVLERHAQPVSPWFHRGDHMHIDIGSCEYWGDC